MTGVCLAGNVTRAAAVICAVCFGALLIGCQPGTLQTEAVRNCEAIVRAVDLSARIDTLDLLSEAFAARCDELVVQYGAQARTRFRHKSFSVTREATNVFVPESTDMVMAWVISIARRRNSGGLSASSYCCSSGSCSSLSAYSIIVMGCVSVRQSVSGKKTSQLMTS